ncbi:2-isopropylmalate synthase [Lebetimonas natsushimae]|uniref:2-isopropylmalate synthase n=1 Tax=Lebetimonas natsushimae TaxID=1936991 RepID=A0A292YIB3_9BACT|nr:2-isopropylmalate synthase [Lebetimonas natsushimae]GAX88320.1 2-isopropylmalate synthase [Lebetimonas natsushimae]
MEMVKIFDTTLRDGEQSPGASMTIEEKIKVAKQLEKLNVDIIEAGFAAASPGDFEAINSIAKEITNSTVCSLARALDKDIEAAAKAIEPAPLKRIHTFIATSPIHMEYKLKMTPDEVIKRAVKAVEYARSFVDDVEFSCEDAGRSEMSFLKEIISAVIEAGATTINIPDTVGYRFPTEMGAMIKELVEYFPKNITFSVHCHNDLGLATANSLYSILNGARQVECTINGLGERAGNAALEEIVMAIKVRRDLFDGIDTRINTKEIYPTSRLVSSVTGIEPQPNKAIVGRNAFAHESGIHQDGVLKHKETYEIMRAEDIGLDVKDTIVLGKHSGRHAFKKKLEALGFTNISDEELNEAFMKFKKLADKKKEIYDEDILAIINDSSDKTPKTYELISLQLSDCSDGMPSAAAKIKFEDKIYMDAAIGEGTIDAVFKVIDRISGISGRLMDYKVEAVSEGKDALAKVMVKVVFDENKPAVMGHGLSIDTMVASARAYINALNNYLHMKDLLSKKISYKDSI